MWRTFLTIIIAVLFSGISMAGDLYQVWIGSESDADILRQSGAKAVVRTADGYLVLANDAAIDRLNKSNLKITWLAEDIMVENLAVNISHKTTDQFLFPTVFRDGDLRLFHIDKGAAVRSIEDAQLSPVSIDGLPIEFRRPMTYNPRAISAIVGLDSLIGLVNQDSIIAYTGRLQAFYRRVVGTDSSIAATNWIKEKFESFGYDSVTFDTFNFHSSYGYYTGRNVICTKPGSKYPEWTIIVGAHHDAVPGSPGANDNGSGTVGVLEIARVLSQIDMDVTLKFITFDGEEYGLHGAWHVSNRAVAENEPLICMLNMDMIANLPNSTNVRLYHGAETSFAHLWSDLADSLVRLNGILSGTSGGSDHYPFQQNGFAVTFAIEYIFSSVYHSAHDSTTYMNFDYMQKIIQSTLATAYTVNLLPPYALITSVVDSGSGDALRVNWVAMDPGQINHFWLYYYPSGNPGALDSVVIAGADSSYIVTGLIEDEEYAFYLLPYDSDGRTAVEYHIAYGTPHSIPSVLRGLAATTKVEAIELVWNKNPELDIDHYRIMRDDSLLPIVLSDTTYFDNDPMLGADLHTYQVFAVDVDAYLSDTAGIPGVVSKAATLQEHRILAINRSTDQAPYIVNESITGEFIREALAGFDYDYYSDTAYLDDDITERLEFFDLIDYELVVIGGESAIQDDIGGSTGLLEILGDYMALGGKVIIFGRWGWLNFEATLEYDSNSTDYEYNTLFDIPRRALTLTSSDNTELISDMIGAYGGNAGYPELVWDSAAAVMHSSPYTDVIGIPCVSWPDIPYAELEIIYQYRSTDNCCANHGRAIAWRQTGPDYPYIFFEIPLSFMERSAAVAALSRAVIDFGFPLARFIVDLDTVNVMALEGETTDMLLGDLTGGRSASDIMPGSITVNGSLAPLAVDILSSYPEFTGDVCRVTVSSVDLAGFYEPVLGMVSENVSITWQFDGASTKYTAETGLTIIGHAVGDANSDEAINVGDAVFLISYVFKSGPAPFPFETGDVNCDEAVNVGDAVYLINYIFKNGPPPCTGSP